MCLAEASQLHTYFRLWLLNLSPWSVTPQRRSNAKVAMYYGVRPRWWLIVLLMGIWEFWEALSHSSITTALDRIRTQVIVHLAASQAGLLCRWLARVSACSLPRIRLWNGVDCSLALQPSCYSVMILFTYIPRSFKYYTALL